MGVPQRRLKFTLFDQNLPQRAPAACPKRVQHRCQGAADTAQKNQTVIKLLSRPRDRRGAGGLICLIHAFLLPVLELPPQVRETGKSAAR